MMWLNYVFVWIVMQAAAGVYQLTTIDNPTVTFIREIPGGMTPGRVIYVVGIPNPSAARFIINLWCGPKCSPEDIPLHLAVRFNYGQLNTVVLNSMKQGALGKEETLTSFPFKQNVQFEIKIVCEPSSFKIYVNNQYFAKFIHRINMKRATHIEVWKDLRLTQVRFDEQPLPNDDNNEDHKERDFVQPWPVELGKPLLVNCTLDNIIGGIQNLSGIDQLEFIFRVTLEVGDGETYASLYDPKLNRTDLDQQFKEKYGKIPNGLSKGDFKMGGDAMNGNYTMNARRIFVAMETNNAQCPHVTDYTCVFQYFTNYSKRSSKIKRFKRISKKFDAKTNISPNPVILGHPMTVTCSESANNDDVKVTIVEINLFIKHEESYKRLFTYNIDESMTNSTLDIDGFQLPGVTTNNFNASFYLTDGKPRHFLTMKVRQALREQISMYKCQFIVIWPNGCTKAEEFLSGQNVGVECPELCGNHNCEVKEGVATCQCLPGYVNSGPLHCHDIDECEQHHDICQNHRCVNTNGSYMCECRHGYHSISLQTCVEDNNINPDILEKKSIFELKSIEALVVTIGFSLVATGFFITVAVLCAKTVVISVYRYATTEPIEGTTVQGTLCHYVVVTKYVEQVKKSMEQNVARNEGRKSKLSVFSNEDNKKTMSPGGSDLPLNVINGSFDHGSFIPKIINQGSFIPGSVNRGSFTRESAKPSMMGSLLPSKAGSAFLSKIKMQ